MAKVHHESIAVGGDGSSSKRDIDAVKEITEAPGLDLPRRKDKKSSLKISRTTVSAEAENAEQTALITLPTIQKRVRPAKMPAQEAAIDAAVNEKTLETSITLPAKKRKPKLDTPSPIETTHIIESGGPTPIISGDPDDINTKLRKLTQPFFAPKLTKTGARMEIPMDTIWNLATFSSRTNTEAMRDFLTYTRVNPTLWRNATGSQLQRLCSKVQRKNCAKKKVLLDATSEAALMPLAYNQITESRHLSNASPPPKKRRIEKAKAINDNASQEVFDAKDLARRVRVRLVTDGGDDYTDISSDEEVDIEPAHYEKAITLLEFVKQCAEQDLKEQSDATNKAGLKMMRMAVAPGNVLPEHMNIKTQALVRNVIHNQDKMMAMKDHSRSMEERKGARKVARRDWSKLQTRVSELIEAEGIDTRKAAELAMIKVFGKDASSDGSDAEV